MSGQYRPWPKRHDGFRNVLDKPLVKAQYFESKFFAWRDFCNDLGYDSSYQNSSFPIRAWREEKLRIQIEQDDESIVQEARDNRLQVLKERLKYPKQWNQESERSLYILRYIEKLAIDDINHDVENQEQIKSGALKPKFRLKPSDMRFIVGAKKELQELHLASLLVNPSDAYRAVIPIKDVSAEEVSAEAEGERLKEIGWKLLDGTAIDTPGLTRMLHDWVDQYKTPGSADPVSPTESTLDQPLTPLEDDDEG